MIQIYYVISNYIYFVCINFPEHHKPPICIPPGLKGTRKGITTWAKIAKWSLHGRLQIASATCTLHVVSFSPSVAWWKRSSGWVAVAPHQVAPQRFWSKGVGTERHLRWSSDMSSLCRLVLQHAPDTPWDWNICLPLGALSHQCRHIYNTCLLLLLSILLATHTI